MQKMKNNAINQDKKPTKTIDRSTYEDPFSRVKTVSNHNLL